MIGGKIIDWITTNEHTRILVGGTGSEKHDTITVRVDLPLIVLGEIKVGDFIWWQNDKVFLNKDVPFKKVSNSSGNAKTFYNDKLNINHQTIINSDKSTIKEVANIGDVKGNLYI